MENKYKELLNTILFRIISTVNKSTPQKVHKIRIPENPNNSSKDKKAEDILIILSDEIGTNMGKHVKKIYIFYVTIYMPLNEYLRTRSSIYRYRKGRRKIFRAID